MLPIGLPGPVLISNFIFEEKLFNFKKVILLSGKPKVEPYSTMYYLGGSIQNCPLISGRPIQNRPFIIGRPIRNRPCLFGGTIQNSCLA